MEIPAEYNPGCNRRRDQRATWDGGVMAEVITIIVLGIIVILCGVSAVVIATIVFTIIVVLFGVASVYNMITRRKK